LSDAIHTLRLTLEGFLRAEAAAAVAELGGEAALPLARAIRRRFRALGEEESREAAASIAPPSSVEIREAEAVADHLRRFDHLATRARARDLRSAAWGTPLAVLGSRTPREAVAALARGQRVDSLFDGLRQAAAAAEAELSDLARALVPRPSESETPSDAQSWLDETQDLFAAAAGYLTGDVHEPGLLLAALTASPFPAQGRLRRTGVRCETWGLASALHRTRRAGAIRDLLLGLAVVPSDPPATVHLAAAPVEFGLLSDFDAAHAVGRALSRLWVSPALPVALRWPAEDSVGEVFGGLSTQLLWTPLALLTCSGAAERERQRRRVGAILLGATRLFAGLARWALGARDAATAPDAWREAWGIQLSPALALLLMPDPERCVLLFRTALHALATWVALRERLDEDWYLNPRAAEVLRAAAERGAGLTSGEWLTELGGRLTDALGRAHELFPS